MIIPEDWQAPDHYFQDRVIVITGAGSGIGAAVSHACARLGATVILMDKIIPSLERVYDSIEAEGSVQPAIYPMNFEGATEKDYLDLAATLEKEFGRLDGLLHNAAMLGALVPLAHFETELWYKILQVNLNAPSLLTRSCLTLLMQSDAASVVLNSDKVGRQGKAYWGAYGAAKAAMENYIQVLADEMETNTSVRANSIDPGPVSTALRSLAYPGENPEEMLKPDDVVRPFLYLLGDASKGITGQQFEI